MSSVETRLSLTLEDLGHDPERDRPWHIPRDGHQGVGNPSVALCGARYIARAPRHDTITDRCVVCNAIAIGAR